MRILIIYETYSESKLSRVIRAAEKEINVICDFNIQDIMYLDPQDKILTVKVIE